MDIAIVLFAVAVGYNFGYNKCLSDFTDYKKETNSVPIYTEEDEEDFDTELETIQTLSDEIKKKYPNFFDEDWDVTKLYDKCYKFVNLQNLQVVTAKINEDKIEINDGCIR